MHTSSHTHTLSRLSFPLQSLNEAAERLRRAEASEAELRSRCDTLAADLEAQRKDGLVRSQGLDQAGARLKELQDEVEQLRGAQGELANARSALAQKEAEINSLQARLAQAAASAAPAAAAPAPSGAQQMDDVLKRLEAAQSQLELALTDANEAQNKERERAHQLEQALEVSSVLSQVGS